MRSEEGAPVQTEVEAEQPSGDFGVSAFGTRVDELMQEITRLSAELPALNEKVTSLAIMRPQANILSMVGRDLEGEIANAEASIAQVQAKIIATRDNLSRFIETERERLADIGRDIYISIYRERVAPTIAALEAATKLQEAGEDEAKSFDAAVARFNSVVAAINQTQKMDMNSSPLAVLRRRPRIRELFDRFKNAS